jgi:hypothetical protein
MATHTGSKGKAKNSKSLVEKSKKPRSLAIAERGVKTSHDFTELMSALISDLIEGNVAPNVANATCVAGGKLLRIVELQYRYGTANKPKTFILSSQNGSHE